MTETMKSIGQVAKQFDLTLRALRHWEGKGLVQPVRQRQRRFYPADQIERIAKIKMWSDAGIPLAEIRVALEEGSNDRLREILENLREEAVNRAAAIYRATEHLEKAA